MPRLLATAFAVLLCLPASARDFKVLNPPSPGDPVYVIPPGICGNGVVEDGEECDPGYPDLGVDPDMGDATCEGQGFNGGGEVSCTAKCTVDISACDCEVGTKFPATGQTRCFGYAGGPVVDCSGTGQDGEIRAGGALSYIDNGDGTITDANTGLMWERKNDDGGVHDKDAVWPWHVAPLDATSSFVWTLNNTCEGDGYSYCYAVPCSSGLRCGLGGHRDWRIPNIKELQSIVDYGKRYPEAMIDPVFNTGCVSGCTECSCTADSYWSSTRRMSSFGIPNAWVVSFDAGYVYSTPTMEWGGNLRLLNVRAVRGGYIP